MKVLVINLPYQTLTSNLGVGHQTPLGLLAVSGPLIDAGRDVTLIDAECRHMSIRDILHEVQSVASPITNAAMTVKRSHTGGYVPSTTNMPEHVVSPHQIVLTAD